MTKGRRKSDQVRNHQFGLPFFFVFLSLFLSFLILQFSWRENEVQPQPFNHNPAHRFLSSSLPFSPSLSLFPTSLLERERRNRKWVRERIAIPFFLITNETKYIFLLQGYEISTDWIFILIFSFLLFLSFPVFLQKFLNTNVCFFLSSQEHCVQLKPVKLGRKQGKKKKDNFSFFLLSFFSLSILS